MCDSSDDGFGPQFMTSEWKVAKRSKAHSCCVCGEEITRGHTYHHTFGVWDGDASTFKHCVRCWTMFELVGNRLGEAPRLDLGCGESWESSFEEAAPEAVAALAFALPGELKPKANEEIRALLGSPGGGSDRPGAFYYGTETRSRARLYVPGMRVVPRQRFNADALPPWVRYGNIQRNCPSVAPSRWDDDARKHIEGVAALDHGSGWTMLSFWDRTAHDSPASHSHIMIRGEHAYDAMVESATKYFPEVMRAVGKLAQHLPSSDARRAG